MRDDFTLAVKQEIAAQAGHACSRPDCSAATSGPRVDPTRSVNVGVAAHIHAASPGGPRYLASMTTAERSSAENGVWLCQNCGKLVDNDPTRFTAPKLNGWKQAAEAKAFNAVGKTKRTRRTASKEAEIRRDLKVRDRLKKIMLRPVEERRKLRYPSRPMDKFRVHKFVVRSLEDTKYPEVDEKPPSGISSWLVFEPYDFYHGGLSVILNIRYVALGGDGHWAYLDYRLAVPEGTPGIAKAWVLGEIPWRNIREVDPDGDNYYRGPHLFCTYADDGMPYERIIASVMGELYDSPLDPTKQHEDITSLDEIQTAEEEQEPPDNKLR